MASSGTFDLVYMTAGNFKEAARIGEALVRERLAACVNILGPIASLYWWDGSVRRGREIAFLAKTRRSLVKKLVARVKRLHGYDVPCVVAIPIREGNPDFLKWLGRETVRRA